MLAIRSKQLLLVGPLTWMNGVNLNKTGIRRKTRKASPTNRQRMALNFLEKTTMVKGEC